MYTIRYSYIMSKRVPFNSNMLSRKDSSIRTTTITMMKTNTFSEDIFPVSLDVLSC